MFNFGWVARPQVMSFYLVSLDAFFILFTSGITNLSLYKHSYLIRLTNLSNTVKAMTILIRLIKYLHLFSRCKRHTKIAACKQALKREAPLRGFHTSSSRLFFRSYFPIGNGPEFGTNYHSEEDRISAESSLSEPDDDEMEGRFVFRRQPNVQVHLGV